MKIRVDNGKYEFRTASNGYGIDVLRHDEGWDSDLPCPKAIHSMMYELDAARLVVQAARKLCQELEAEMKAAPILVDALRKHAALVDDRELPSEWTK